MALTKCKECGNPVSRAAESCPKCGHPIKGKRAGGGSGCSSGCGTLVLLLIGAPILLAIIIPAYQDSQPKAPESPEVRAQREAAQEAERAQCRQNLQCWADEAKSFAEVYCADPIERLANYSARWTDSWLESKFDRIAWADQDQGHIRYIGDKAEFQNGFGAWKRVTYYCDVDVENERVIDVAVVE